MAVGCSAGLRCPWTSSGSYDKTVRIWSSGNDQLLSTLEGHTDTVRAVTFSPDGIHIASSSDDTTVRIWSSHNDRLLFTLEGHTGAVDVIAFSLNGAHIASCSLDGTIQVWFMKMGEFISHYDRNTYSMGDIVCLLDGKQWQDSFPPLDSAPTTLRPSGIEAPKLQLPPAEYSTSGQSERRPNNPDIG